MTELGAAIEQLDALPFAWLIGKGRFRDDEKLWAVALFRQPDRAIADDEPAFQIEGDSLRYCVTRAVAWVEKQTVKEPS